MGGVGGRVLDMGVTAGGRCYEQVNGKNRGRTLAGEGEGGTNNIKNVWKSHRE